MQVSAPDSPLRQARKTIPATLEQVCGDLDRQSPNGASGVTPSMLSGWELGKHTTSVHYRAMLAAYYQQPPDVLFAHQDRGLTADSETPTLVLGYRAMQKAMIAVVGGARTCLAVTGSRTRDSAYMAAIESVLECEPALVHYRVLFGPPRHASLTEHLLRLLAIRDTADRTFGMQTLNIGYLPLSSDGPPERFFVASESGAVLPMPSLTAADAFDCAVVLGPEAGTRLVDHARQCYAGARRLDSPEQVAAIAAARDAMETPA